MAGAISMRDLRKQAVDAYKKTGHTEILTYPKGEPDAVTVKDSDMDGLQPGQYLSDSIIDFYIKYLQKTSLSPTDRDLFYFFNSFFFTQLLEKRNVSKESGLCSVDYGQLRKWTQGVDLFKKDYIFIPVIYRNHWSLILICHLTSLNRRHEESKPSPCIYHLDSMSGMHESFEREVKSYLLEVIYWLDEKDEGPDKDQVRRMTQALMFMQYVQPKVPQQDNGYDCGLYLMHNVEDILKGVKSNAFSRSSNQLETCFVERISSVVNEKRVAIRNFILQESGVKEVPLYWKPHDENEGQSICNQDLNDSFMIFTKDEHAQQTKVGNIVKHEEGQRDVKLKRVLSDTYLNHDVAIEHVEDEKVDKSEQDQCGQSERLQRTIISDDPGNSQHDEELLDINRPQAQDLRIAKSREMSEKEIILSTSVLLNCMVEGGVYFNEKKIATCWDKISERIEESCRVKLTGKQCQRRFDTLKKAYRIIKTEFCEKYNKSYRESTEEEREKLRKLRLATKLYPEWYEKIGEICEKREKREENRKLQLPQSLKSQSPKRRKSNLYRENDGESKIKSVRIVPYNLEELEEEDFAREKHQFGLLRSSEAQMRDCEERRLRLRFKNKLAQPIFTEDMLTSEKCNRLIVNLEDIDTGETVRSGPWASAELEVVVLALGLTSDVEGNWTEQEFEDHIWDNKLGGDLDIKLMEGEGLLGEVFFNDTHFGVELGELGVRVSPRNCTGFRIHEARTEPFQVQSSGFKFFIPPTLGSEVWNLHPISKFGDYHIACMKMGIFTVEEFLRNKAIGMAIPYLNGEVWERAWIHAMTCKPSRKWRRYERDGRGIVFNHLFEAIGLMEENGPFRGGGSLSENGNLSEYGKELMKKLVPEALRSWEHVVFGEESFKFLTWYTFTSTMK